MLLPADGQIGIAHTRKATSRASEIVTTIADERRRLAAPCSAVSFLSCTKLRITNRMFAHQQYNPSPNTRPAASVYDEYDDSRGEIDVMTITAPMLETPGMQEFHAALQQRRDHIHGRIMTI